MADKIPLQIRIFILLRYRRPTISVSKPTFPTTRNTHIFKVWFSSFKQLCSLAFLWCVRLSLIIVSSRVIWVLNSMFGLIVRLASRQTIGPRQLISACTSPKQKSVKPALLATLTTVALPMPWNEATASARESPWIARRSSAMSLCDSTVARLYITARFFTGGDMVIGALLLHLHLL